MKLKKERDNNYHSLSRKWDKHQKRQGAKRQRANGKYLIREA